MDYTFVKTFPVEYVVEAQIWYSGKSLKLSMDPTKLVDANMAVLCSVIAHQGLLYRFNVKRL